MPVNWNLPAATVAAIPKHTLGRRAPVRAALWKRSLGCRKTSCPLARLSLGWLTHHNRPADAVCRKHCRPSRAREHRFAKRADRRATGVCRPQAIQHATGAARTAAFSILAERDAALEAPIEIEPPL